MSFDPIPPGAAGLRASLGLRPLAKGGSTTEPPAGAARPPEHGAVGKLVSFVHPDSGEQHVGKVISGSHKGVAATDETGRIHRIDHGAYQNAPKGAKPGKLEVEEPGEGDDEGEGRDMAKGSEGDEPAGFDPIGATAAPVPVRTEDPPGTFRVFELPAYNAPLVLSHSLQLTDSERRDYDALREQFRADDTARRAKLSELLGTGTITDPATDPQDSTEAKRPASGYHGLTRPGLGVGSGAYWQLLLGVDPNGEPESRAERAARLAPTEQ